MHLHSTMATVSRIIEDSHTDTNDRIHAHSLMLDCIDTKQRLISDATIVQEALDVVEQTKQRLVELHPSSTATATVTTAEEEEQEGEK